MNLLIPHLHVGVFVSFELRQTFPRAGLSGQRVQIFWTLPRKCLLSVSCLRENLGRSPTGISAPLPGPSLPTSSPLIRARSGDASLG